MVTDRADSHKPKGPEKSEIKRSGPNKKPWSSGPGAKPGQKGYRGKSPGKGPGRKTPQQYKRRELPTKNNMTHDEMVAVWEKMRVKKLSPPERLRYINSIIGYFVSNVVLFARKPVEVRVLRFILKHGSEECRHAILTETIGHVQDLIVDKYGTKLVERLGGCYKWDRQTSMAVIDKLLPNISKLTMNTNGATTISYIYQSVPLKVQNRMLIALVGPFINITNSEVIAREKYILKEAALVSDRFTAFFQDCIKILRKAMKKNLLGCTLITKLAADTLRMIFGCFHSTIQVKAASVAKDDDNAADEDKPAPEPQVKKLAAANLQNINETTLTFVSELTEALLEENAFMSLLDTVDSVYVSSFMLQLCTAKNRKEIVKTVRPHVVHFASDPMAFIFLCKLFAVTDDTITTVSSLISGEGGIGQSLSTILRTRAGIRTVYFLLFGLEKMDVSGKGVTPIFTTWMAEIWRQTNLRIVCSEGDLEKFPGCCKKDPQTKQAELRANIMPFLLDALVNEDLLVSLMGTCEDGSHMLCELIVFLDSLEGEALFTAPPKEKSKSSKKDKADPSATSRGRLQELLEAIARAACRLVDPAVRSIRQTDKDLLHQGTAGSIMKAIAKQQKKALEAAKKEDEEQRKQAKEAENGGDEEISESFSDVSSSDDDNDASDDGNGATAAKGKDKASAKDAADDNKPKKGGRYVPCAPEDRQPLFRHDIGYFSVRRVLNNYPKFGTVLLKAFQTQDVPAKFFADKRGAFMLEHIVKTDDDNLKPVKAFVSKNNLTEAIVKGECRGSEALRTVLELK